MVDSALGQTIRNLKREAGKLRSEFEEEWDTGFQYFIGEQWRHEAPDGLVQITVNKVQPAVIASVQTQTEERPNVSFRPVQTNEPPMTFLSPGGAMKAVAFGGAAGLNIPREMALGLVPLPDELVGMIAGMTGPSGVPIFTPDDFQIVNDNFMADMVKQAWDVLWSKSDADSGWMDSILYKVVFGQCATLIQWNADKTEYEMFPIHPRHWWIDPTCRGIKDASYFIHDRIVSVESAREFYPDFDRIPPSAWTDKDETESGGDSTGTGVGDVFQTGDFERKMVRITTAYQRHVEYPMSPDEALAKRKVEWRQGPSQVDPATGMIQPSAEIMVLTETGQPVDPSSPQWPKEFGIRQTVTVGDHVLMDMKCPYDDIPVVINVNTQIPFRPYAQGLPKITKNIQDAINRIATNFVNHLRYYAHPQEIMPKSVRDALGDKAKKLYAHPGRRTIVPDEIMQMYGGKVSMFIDPPTLPASYVDLFTYMLKLFDEISGNVDVLQGIMPQGQPSGKLVASLQNAARGPLQYRAKLTGQAIKHMARIVIGAMRDFMTDEEWLRILGGLAPGVVAELRKRLQDAEFDIQVEIVGGDGSSRDQKRQETVTLFQLGLIDPQTARERLAIPDAKKIEQRLMAMQMQAQAQSSATVGKSDVSTPSKPAK